jgi:hypothetical protein
MERIQATKSMNGFQSNSPIYREQLLTIESLMDFKRQLIFELKAIMKEYAGQSHNRWIKSQDVRKFLKISPGTLQNMRITGALSYTKIGGIFYYDLEDIEKMMLNRRNSS